MIKAKDLETMAQELSHLGLPFKELIFQQGIDNSAKELSINIQDASHNDNPSFRFCIKKEDTGDYTIYDYEAKMLLLPIEHGHYIGIDTLQLENQMKEIKWILLPIYKKEHLIDLFDKIDRLRDSEDLQARDIGEKLCLKYFSNTPLEEMFPMPDKKPYEKMIVVPIHNNGNDVDINQAVQLMQGKALLKYRDVNGQSGELCWLKEDKGYLKVYPDFNVADIIKQMPLLKQPDIIELSEIISGLGLGKPYETSLVINRRVVEGSIHVEPASNSLEFRDKTGTSVNWKMWTKLDQNKKPGRGKKGPGL